MARRLRSTSQAQQLPDRIPKAPEKIIFSDHSSDDLIQSLSMEERHRQELIYDLLNIERYYVYELTLFTEIFLNPIIMSKFLTKQEIHSTFTNFSDIVNVSKALLEDCEARQKRDVVIMKIGDTFLNQEQNFKLYTAYATNFPLVQMQLNHLVEKNVPLNDFLQKTLSSPELQGKNFLYFLALPINHLGNYPKQFQDISEYTPPEHGDYQDIQQALEMMNSFVSIANQAIAHSVSVQKLTELQKRLAPLNQDFRLVLPSRIFIRQGVVTATSKQTRKSMSCDMILCNDLILLIKKGKNKIAKAITTSLRLADIVDEHGNATNSFELLCGDDYIISASTKEEKAAWIQSLDQNYSFFEREEKMQKVFMTDKTHTPKRTLKMSKIFKRQSQDEVSIVSVEPSPDYNFTSGAHPRVAAQLNFLIRKLQRTRDTGETLRKQITSATEKKKHLEKELEALHANDNHIQLQNRLQLHLTLLSAEGMLARWFAQQLDKVQRETTIIQRDLERTKKQAEEKDKPSLASPALGVANTGNSISNANIAGSPPPVNANQGGAVKLKEDDKHYLNMLAFEQEKGKFLESEKDRLAGECKQSLQKLQNEVESSIAQRQKASETVARLRLELKAEADRRKTLLHNNALLRARIQAFRDYFNTLPLDSLKQIREVLLAQKIAQQTATAIVSTAAKDSVIPNPSSPPPIQNTSSSSTRAFQSPSTTHANTSTTTTPTNATISKTPTNAKPGPSSSSNPATSTTTTTTTTNSTGEEPPPTEGQGQGQVQEKTINTEGNAEEAPKESRGMSAEQRRQAMGMLREPRPKFAGGGRGGALPKMGAGAASSVPHSPPQNS